MQCLLQQVTTEVKLLPTKQCQLGLIQMKDTSILYRNVFQYALQFLYRFRAGRGLLQPLRMLLQSSLSAYPRPLFYFRGDFLALLRSYNLSYNMASSPYLSNDLKTYLRKFDIEKLINRNVNDLLKAMPEDPYAFMIGQLQQFASPSVEIIAINAVQIVSGEGFPLLKLKFQTRFFNKVQTVCLNQPFSILSDENMLYDEDRLGGKGLNKSIKFLVEKIAPKIIGLKCEQQQDIDRQIEKAYVQNNNLGIYIVNSLSYAPLLVRSSLLNQQPYKLVAEQFGVEPAKTLKSMVNCLHGGKVIGSKCKVFKYYLVCKNVTDPTLLQSALQGVRKAIVSGKGGETALKYSPDGTFICPLDTIADNLKIVEEAIAGCGGKQSLGIGLSWAADTLFSPDTKKYELQNPKAPLDNDQMIDFIFKMLQDKPSIVYIEDPLASSEKAAWKKFITKVRDTQSTKNVKIGTRSGKLINLLDPNLKGSITDLSVPQTSDSHPDSTQQARNSANALKFNLDIIQIRLFELKTYSNLIKISKQLKKVKTNLLLQDCTLQSYDTTLIDICAGLDTFSNLGSISKFDRICKLNRMREILEDHKNS